MKKTEITINVNSGVHARPATLFVKVANRFPCEIFVEKGSERVNGKSIMGILMLALGEGTKINIITEGEKEEEAMEALLKLIQSDFEVDAI